MVVGDHTVTFQFVAPPRAPAPAAPAPAPRALSPEELAAQQRREAKPHQTLFLSATVLDSRITELHWSEGGKKYRGFSNIDFRHFSGLTEIETADTICTLMLALENETAGMLATRTGEFPQLAQLPKDRAAWLLVESPADGIGSNAAALDSIHSWFDANRGGIVRASERREAAKAERERQERERPPARKDRVISIWKRNSAPPPQDNGAPQ